MADKSGAVLYMVPVPLLEDGLHTLPAEVYGVTASLRYYFAENIRTARRFLRSLHRDLVLEEIEFAPIDKHSGADLGLARKWLKEGRQVGVLSEAGCPGIADPGSAIAALAHSMGVAVKPLTGPNSMTLALMASGLNGQCFAFVGYLPVRDPERSKRIKELERRSARDHETQLMIETPYRNNALLADILKHCEAATRLCIAINLTAPDEQVHTRTIADWRKNTPQLEKQPAVFLLLAG